MDRQSKYAAAVEAETRRYERCHHVHDLPPIFHYWSHTHIHPQLLKLGFAGPDQLFAKYLGEIFEAGSGPKRFVSLGSGNCDLEVSLAATLCQNGNRDFIIECVDLNPAMLTRGREAAALAGVEAQLAFLEADLNRWRADGQYDAVMANQSLHHIVELEAVFVEVKRALRPDGRFVVSDMIGRNGHQRWPEALEMVHEFWRKLPPSYRFNRQSGYYEEWYEDRDYSAEGFEGVRAQDILPLLLENFSFRMFFGFANAIDPFVDRAFGPNFDANAEWDRAFIDALHERDQREIASGRLTPTHMLAVMNNAAGAEFSGNLRPEQCVRPAGRAVVTHAPSKSAYADSPWPHDAAAELALVRDKLTQLTAIAKRQSDSYEGLRSDVQWVAQAKAQLEDRTDWAERMERQFLEHTEWAKRLEIDVADRTAWARRMETQAEERTAWAMRLSAEVEGLQRELNDRTAWAEGLNRQLTERTAWAKSLETELRNERARAEELQHDLRNPLRWLGRAAKGLLRRVGLLRRATQSSL